MRIRFASIALVLAALATTALGFAQAGRSQTMLEEARKLEVVDGNYAAAIKQYQAIVDRFSTTEPGAAATALLRMAECYEKTGNAQAKETLERVIKLFPGQSAQVAEARARLASLGQQESTRAEARLMCGGAECRFDLSSISRDGRWVATGAGDLLVHDRSTGASVTLVKSVQDALGDVENALIAPDGQSIAYTWCCDTPTADRSSLRVISNQPGATPRPLLESRQGTWPWAVAWSADGSRVLAIIRKEDWSSQLAWVSVATGALTVIATRPSESPLQDASLSPDGRFVAYSTGPQRANQQAPRQMYVIDANSGGRERLISSGSSADNNPAWTADGKYLLYTSDRAATSDLWAVPMRDGAGAGDAFRVKADVGPLWAVGVTSDGFFYYFRRRDRLQKILVLDLDTTGSLPGRPRIVETFVGRQPSWSPDGEHLAFEKPPVGSSTSAQMIVHSFDSGRDSVHSLPLPIMQVRGPDHGRAVSRPLWFSDGSGFVQQFEADEGQVPGDRDVNYGWFRLDLNRGQFERVTSLDRIQVPREGHSIGWRRPVALSRDHRTAYLFLPEPSQLARLVSVDLSTGDQQVIFAVPGSSKAWPTALAPSPDGRELALAANENGGTNFAVVGVDGTGYREVGHFAAPGITAGQLAWTRDGRSLLFTARPADGVCRLMRISATGGQAEFTGFQVPSPSMCRFAVNPVDGRVAMGISENASELWAIDVSEAALLKKEL